MNTPTIEELRSEEAHADTNFTELQALRKIHQEALKKLDAAESLVIQLENERQRLLKQNCELIDILYAPTAHASNSESAIDAFEGAADKNPGGQAF